jgi:hypothetical protein
VYVSDIKKVLSWYNILQKSGLLDKKEEEASDKPKIKAPAADAKGAAKAVKDTSSKPVKTAGTKVKTQGVRKTGVA